MSSSIDFVSLARELTSIKRTEEAMLARAAMEAIITRVNRKKAWSKNTTLADKTMPTTEDFPALTQEIVTSTIESRKIVAKNVTEAVKLDGLSLAKVVKAANWDSIELLRAAKDVELIYVRMIEDLNDQECETAVKLAQIKATTYAEDYKLAKFVTLSEHYGRIKSEKARAEANIDTLREIFITRWVHLDCTSREHVIPFLWGTQAKINAHHRKLVESGRK